MSLVKRFYYGGSFQPDGNVLQLLKRIESCGLVMSSAMTSSSHTIFISVVGVSTHRLLRNLLIVSLKVTYIIHYYRSQTD